MRGDGGGGVQPHRPTPTQQTNNFKQRRFTHAPSGVASDTHPCHRYYVGALFLDRGGYAALKAALAAEPPSDDEVSVYFRLYVCAST